MSVELGHLAGLQAKTSAPRPAARAVSRPALIKLMDSALDVPVTTVVAPAGFGKTWLVAGWMQKHPDVAQCWMTVDDFDRDPLRFWSHLVMAVHESATSPTTAEPLRLLRETGVGTPLVVGSLAQGLAELGEEFLIALDDVHHLDGSEALKSLAQFLEWLPPNVHVVLIGRARPGLQLARRHVSGEVAEINTDDMRMSLDETRALIVESMGLDIDDESVAEIHERTMGWVVGARLAATAAGADGFGTLAVDVAKAETDRAYDAIGDYLIQEALNQLDGADRRFLLDTSILQQLNGSLCDAVSGRADSAEFLHRLARDGMFTSRIAGDGVWYQYHSLFRQALHGLLRRMSPDVEPELHRRAALWLSDSGRPIEAIKHALASGDADLAASWLLEHSRDLLVAKQYDTMCTLFSDVDDASQASSPPFVCAWMFPILFGSTSGAEIDRALDRGRESLATMSVETERASVAEWQYVPLPFHESPAELGRAVDATIAHRRGDVELAAATLAAQQLEGPSESGWIEAATSELLVYTGRYSRAAELAKRWHDYTFSPVNPIIGNQAYTLAIQAHIRLGEGRISEAEVLASRGVDLMRDAGLGDASQVGVASVPLAWAKWETGDLRAAEDAIAPVLDGLARLAEVPSYVLAHTLLARVRSSRGDSAGVTAALDEATVMRAGTPVTGYFADVIAFERARNALTVGDLAAAELALPDWRERAARGATTMREHLVLGRLTIAAGDDPAVLLDSAPPEAEVTPAHEIEVLTLRAVAAVGERDETAALDYLAEAMRMARATGHRQLFLDDEATFGALLDNAAAMSDHDVRHYQETAPEANGAAGSLPVLYDPLTERELEVLRLLASHRTYKEIGETLFISTNTVKYYTKSIYSKLGANRRGEAVAAAQALHLVG